MKNKYNYFVLYILAICFNTTALYSQNNKLSKSTLGALNNYVIYSNEVIHGLNLMYNDFIYLNNQFYSYVEDTIDNITYIKEPILNNYKYFKILPRDLFPVILKDNIYLPYEMRGIPLQLIGKVSNVLKEIEDIRENLSKYLNNNNYIKDTNLITGFRMLQRIEVLYYDIFTLQEKLHWTLTSIFNSLQPQYSDKQSFLLLQELQSLVNHTKLVIKSIRAEGKNSLNYNCLKLNEIINTIERKNSVSFQEKNSESNVQDSIIKNFSAIVNNAKNNLKTAEEYYKAPKYQNKYFKSSYYYYNNILLDNYNRSYGGMIILFNDLIKTNGNYWLLEHKMPKLFEVMYPDIPEYKQYQTDELDIESLIKSALLNKKKADSLVKAKNDSLLKIRLDSITLAEKIADSIEYRKAHPKIGDLNLTGFASNNLVFLLDISSSMNDTNKLPLLKNALTQLLDLMRPEDNITFITYSGIANVVLTPTSAIHKEKILSAIKNLSSGGTSDANLGLKLAYQTIESSIIKNGNNRIIMATDGGIKVSNKIKRVIRKSSKEKDSIKLSIFYFSQKEYTHHKKLLKELAHNGSGKYSYIQKENANKILLLEAQTVRKKDN
ncbi:MAG: VWA domain-containing protein [Saprospiraceae bacterium]|nr:VWA domain-containing protein [Saprospiraceae bacterium]